MAVKKTPAQAAANWGTNFGNAGQAYMDGIDSVQVAPGQLAANQQQAYLQGVTNNVKIWAQKVAAVSLPDWKNAAKTTGAERLASGATKGQPKMQNFMAAFLPDLANIVNSLPPRGSFQQNLARFTNYATQLHNKKGSY